MLRRISDCKTYEDFRSYIHSVYPESKQHVTMATFEALATPIDQLLSMPDSERKKVFAKLSGSDPARTYLFRIFLDNTTATTTTTNYTSSYGGGTGSYGYSTYSTPPIRLAKMSGLKNFGNACYMNALVQSLFHMSYFRAAIYQMPTDDVDPTLTKSEKLIPLALQRLFFGMEKRTEAKQEDSKLEAPVPVVTELMTSFGWGQEERGMQHDIHELMRVLLDNLMKKLVDARQPNVIKQLFAGVLVNYIETTDGSNYKSKRKEAFMDLQLVIRNKKDIYESLKDMFAEEVLDGSNKYLVESPDGSKSYHPAKRGCKLHIAPPVLQFHVTRFDFNMETMNMERVKNKWVYYDSIDMSEFVVPSEPSRQASSMSMGSQDGGLGSREDSDAFFRESSLHALPDDTAAYVYRLYAVVVYQHGYSGGHYFSYVRTGNREWIKFNDESVSHATTDDVFKSNFGGKVPNYYGYEVESNTTAYVLTYIREDIADRILFPSEDIVRPGHLKVRFEEDQAREERKRKERAEDTKCIQIHVATINDVQTHCATNVRGIGERARIPESQIFKVPKQASVRELKTAIEAKLGVPVAHQALWKCDAASRVSPFLPDDTLEDDERFISLFQGYLGNFYADEMWFADVLLVDITKLSVPCKTPTKKEIAVFVKIFESDKVDVDKKDSAEEARPVRYLGIFNISADQPLSNILSQLHPLSGLPPETSYTFEKEGTYGFTALDSSHTPERQLLDDGDCVIAVKETTAGKFKSAAKYLHFVEHSVTVQLADVKTPLEPRALVLLDDMTYKELQKKIGGLLGEDPEFVRLIVHDKKKNSPDFTSYKNKSTYACTLKSLLTSYEGDSDRLYYEITTIKVTVIDTSDVVRFDVVDGSLKPILQGGCVVLPKYATSKDLFSLIRSQLAPEVSQKLGPLRVLSSYLHTIWSVYHLETDPSTKEVRSLYSASTYRVEELPRPIEGVSMDHQELLDFCHFSYVNGRLERHSEPFSMYVKDTDTPDEVLQRVSAKLGLPAGDVLKAKVFTVPYNDFWYPAKVIPKTEVVTQAMAAAQGSDLHVGLEHPPPPKIGAKPAPKDSPLVIRN